MNAANSERLLQHIRLAVVVFSASLAAGSAGMPSPIPTAERPAAKTDLYGDPLPEGAIARMGSIQLRHAGQSDFVVLPDNKTILTAGGRVVRFWDIASGRLVREVKLQGAFSPGRSATPSPDGKILAGIDQKKLVFWDTDSGKQIKTLPGMEESWGHIYFSPDSKTLIVGTYKPQVILWDWQKGVNRRIELPLRRKMGRSLDSTFHSCVSPDGKYLAAQAGAFEYLCIYDLASGRELHRLSCHAYVSTFSSDSKRLIVSQMQNDKKARGTVIRVFDLTSGKEMAQYPLGREDPYFSLAASPDGKTLAFGFSDRGCLLDLTTGRVLYPLPDRPIQVVFSPNGKWLVANMGHRLRIWDTATGKLIHERPGDFGWSSKMAVHPEGRLLAAADWSDQAVSLWDPESGRLVGRLPLKGERQNIYNLSFICEGKKLIACQYKGFLQIWDVASGKELRTLQLHDPSRRNSDHISFYELHVSADGKHVSSLEQFFAQGESTRLAYWDLETAKIVSQYFLPPQTRTGAWSANGTSVALLLKNGLTQMNVENGAVRYQISGTQTSGPLAASPDERLLAALRSGHAKDDAAVGVWEAATGKEIATLATGPVSHLALTPDGRHLVAADDKFLRVWDLATGMERRRWPFPEANISAFSGGGLISAAFPPVTRLLLSPNGRRAFTALNDGTALVWDLQPALRRSKSPAEKTSDKDLAAWWTDLASDDARRAYGSIWRFTEAPEATVPFLRQHVKPATDDDLQAIRSLIVDLDSDEFSTREKASEQLAKLGALAEAALRQALEQKPPVEARRRMQFLLEKIDQQLPTGESLRLLRTVQVLENTGAEGRRLLRELAGGAEGAWLTRAAQAALARLNRLAAPVQE